jgi:predicted DNA-binding transcriptional regulator YafY
MVAWCRLRNDRRLFALHRIQSHEISGEQFEPRDRDELEAWLSSPLFLEHGVPETEIIVKFDAHAARYIRERKWHPNQTLEDLDDGGCLLTFTSTSLDEVKRWLLSFGAAAQVIAPDELREAMQEEFRNSIRNYQ